MDGVGFIGLGLMGAHRARNVLKATVTLSNTGRSTAQNVSVKAADQYTPNKAMSTSQTSIPPGASLTYVFDGPADPPSKQPPPTRAFPQRWTPPGQWIQPS